MPFDKTLSKGNSVEMIVGRSRSFTNLVATADRYAGSPWPVLILGETGVGKELLARRVHHLSGRRGGPFIPLNCGAMPPQLFESEVFGYEKGAFSGAGQLGSRGLLRQAHGGTIFFDEIGDLDPSLQVKLLRFMDSGEVRPLGATRVDQVDVRVIAATNVDLYQAAGEGRFRHDLLERLSVLSLTLPPLRERKDDIIALAESILSDLRCEYHGEALIPFSTFSWPGNIRQMKNVLVRGAVRGGGLLTKALADTLLLEEEERNERRAGSAGFDDSLANGSLEEIEKQVIVARLKLCQGNRKKTAKELGIAKSTLHEKLRRWKTVDGSRDAQGKAFASRGTRCALVV